MESHFRKQYIIQNELWMAGIILPCSSITMGISHMKLTGISHMKVRLQRGNTQSQDVKCLGIHLDRKLTWRKHISAKRKQLDLKLRKLYWIYMFRASLSPIFRSTKQLHLQHLVTITPYCCLLLSWKSWNWFECVVGDVRHPQHTQIRSNSSTIAEDNSMV